MEEEFDEYEALSTYRQNGNLAIVKGTSRYGVNGYKGQMPQKSRTPPNGVELVRLWLNDDTDFALSQYREWIRLADEFLDTVTYSKAEHTDLLVRAFELYVTKHT